MRCNYCLKDREERDFYGKSICYKCVYDEKMEIEMVKLKNKRKCCPLCGLEIPSNKVKYCSFECADIARKEQVSNRTYNKLRRYLPRKLVSGYGNVDSIM